VTTFSAKTGAVRVAVIGDRVAGLPPQDTIETALVDSARALGTAVDVAWFATPGLDRDTEWYGVDQATERYYCRFGLNEDYAAALAEAGLVVAGVDAADGTTRIMRRPDHPFFALTLFVPQTSSTPDGPHPVITRDLAAAVSR
jgi:CTP synthase (UTP-ammonia lyase)